MSLHVAIRHNTYYDYDRLIHVGPQVIRLKPAPHARTPILAYSMQISPEPHFINWQQDPFGNYMARVVFPEQVDHFHVEVEVIVDMVTINPFDFFLEEQAETFPFTYSDQLKKELQPYLELKDDGPLLNELFEQSRSFLEDQTNNFLVGVNNLIYERVNYTIRLEPGIQSCEETLEKQSGSCRDSAWLLVQILRRHGLAARFVSGYLIQLAPDQKSIDGPSGTERDFTDLHAWAEVYLPGAGWVGLDATSGLLTGEGHIPLSCTPDPVSAAPITGLTDPCEVEFRYENLIERIYETPRVTKPHTDDQWEQILKLGDHIDGLLEQGDVRLTMGGEPTFVSTDMMESDEWNTDADGFQKRTKAYQLATRLRDRLAPGGLIHQGQGKWYPGEPIPRWQYAIYWRKDGTPVWRNPKWLATPQEELHYGPKKARKFLKKLSKRLGVSSSNIAPAYEDIYYFNWENGTLPLNWLDIPEEDLSLEKKRLKQLLEEGIQNEIGYVLPLQYGLYYHRWESCHWKFNRKHLYLLPGNSAMGYRLPLDQLPYQSPEEKEVVIEPSMLDDLGELVDPTTTAKPNQFISVKSTIKTAICAEIRNGRLYVFLPPLNNFDQFAMLMHHLEEVASSMEIKVIIEGYQPPTDYRVEKLAVTPDPGVVEVNVAPAHSWREILQNYNILFEEASKSYLVSEKFMLDGRHTGTGGGNHITLGGVTPSDSPLLRRPDLLRSMVNFWQNHPSLSYLFSTAFVGPTSQAPRADEGRWGNLDDLRIAFKELDKYPQPQPWIVDRLFRNMLVDITGNTHRAEFCIDKLYNPDSNSGRLGILELRGFEMPPSKQMCLIQLLLIRGLVAAFWKNPYREPLQDWGKGLHDKYLLHHYCREDMHEVVQHLQKAGIPFELDWLESFFAFRFPVLGEAQVQNTKLTIRGGIEPWIVLGEEMSSTGTARFVDSSVEKLEILAEGLDTNRYLLLCNQIVVPLQSTGEKNNYVAGIRYKAWNPPSSLHPTIPVDTPLTFDIYDTWNERPIGGCTYYVSHPGGRSYDTFPINALEAQARRISRFAGENHTITNRRRLARQAAAGRKAWIEPTYTTEMEPIKLVHPDEHQTGHTLDLRWF